MGKAKTSRFIREYGVTLQTLADKYGLSTTYLVRLDLIGKLHDFIKEQDKKEAEVLDR